MVRRNPNHADITNHRQNKQDMPHCPDCRQEVDSVQELERDFHGLFKDDEPVDGTVMFSCPSCGVILGVSEWKDYSKV